jgi:diacylglycerol kinase (ATP)
MPAGRRALLIINPEARRQPRRKRLEEGISWLRARGWEVEPRTAHHRGDVERLAAEGAESEVDCVVACGGDGTLHEALNGVVGTKTALALVPTGTVNVWAAEAKLPHDPVEALKILEEGERVRIDTGRAGDRAFLLMASVGIDSLVAGRVSSGLKRRLGTLPYLGLAALEIPNFEGFDAEILLDGERVQTGVVTLVAGNTRSYGRLLSITPQARADDGLLDVCIYTGSGRLRFLQSLLKTAARRHLQDSSVIYYQAREIDVRTQTRWPVQLDGEVVASTPIRLSCVPASLTVVVPAGLRTPLWDRAAALSSANEDAARLEASRDVKEQGG